MLSEDAQKFKEQAEILYSKELIATAQRFQVFQQDARQLLTAMLLENEILLGEVERLKFLIENKSDAQ